MHRRRGTLRGFPALVLVSVAAACSGPHSGTDVANARDISASATETSTSTAARSTSTTVSSLGAGQPVVLAFGGDVHFEGVLHDKLAAAPSSVLSPVAATLSAADIAMVNLETAITTRGTPQSKQYNFRAPPSALTALGSAGVDVATMANNHGLDYGDVGLHDSLAAIRASHFPVLGIGEDAAHAYAPHTATVHGQRIAIIAATQVIDDALIGSWTATDHHAGLASAKNVDRLLTAVRSARASSDTLVVFLHWGRELQTCPTPEQEKLARQLVDAGADVVVGSHAHRLLGAGHLGDAFVDYGLGNLAFYAQPGPQAESGVLLVTMTGRHVDKYEWRPAVIDSGSPVLLKGSAAAAARAEWERRRSCTDLAK